MESNANQSVGASEQSVESSKEPSHKSSRESSSEYSEGSATSVNAEEVETSKDLEHRIIEMAEDHKGVLDKKNKEIDGYKAEINGYKTEIDAYRRALVRSSEYPQVDLGKEAWDAIYDKACYEICRSMKIKPEKMDEAMRLMKKLQPE